ncbi:MAG: hypothetical protein QM286_07105 [Acidobacteriota bacterium]|nr:hypothetical protein [Acidobacteriota bacterium]
MTATSFSTKQLNDETQVVRAGRAAADKVKGMVVAVDQTGSSRTVEWASRWAVETQQQLTVLPRERWAESAGAQVGSVIVDAGVAAELFAPGPRTVTPRGPVLILPEEAFSAPVDAPIVVAVDGRAGCALPLGTAFASAQRLGVPVQVVPLAESDPADVARIHEAVEMFARCYPDVPVSVDPASELSAIFENEQAQLVVTGVMVPGPSSRPRRSPVADATMPVVLVNLAA